jgi:hypothetical protein
MHPSVVNPSHTEPKSIIDIAHTISYRNLGPRSMIKISGPQNILAITPDKIADTPTDSIAVDVGSREFWAHLTSSSGSKNPQILPAKYAHKILPETNAPEKHWEKGVN